MAAKPDYKKYGFIPQCQQGFLVMRIRNKAGNMTAENLRKVAELAERFGNGQVHVTTRQAVEVPGVKEEDFEQALQAIVDSGLTPAVCGPRVRPVVACPGKDTCPYGLVNTRTLAGKLDEQFVGRDLPAKTKFGISGCPNSCTKPQGNDIGLKGVSRPVVEQQNCVLCSACVRRCPAQAMTIANDGLVIDYDKCLSCGICIRICPKKTIHEETKGYHVYIGGKGGRYSNDGELLRCFVPEGEATQYIEAILAVYQEQAEKGERLNKVVGKYGVDFIRNQVQNKLR